MSLRSKILLLQLTLCSLPISVTEKINQCQNWKKYRNNYIFLCVNAEPGLGLKIHSLHLFTESASTGQFQTLNGRCQFSSVAQSCPTLCKPMNHSMPGLPVHHQFLESTQTHVCWVGDAIQPSHPLSSPSPPTLNLSQHQGLFKWVSSSHQVGKDLEFQPQHQSFQWTPRTNLP